MILELIENIILPFKKMRGVYIEAKSIDRRHRAKCNGIKLLVVVR